MGANHAYAPLGIGRAVAPRVRGATALIGDICEVASTGW